HVVRVRFGLRFQPVPGAVTTQLTIASSLEVDPLLAGQRLIEQAGDVAVRAMLTAGGWQSSLRAHEPDCSSGGPILRAILRGTTLLPPALPNPQLKLVRNCLAYPPHHREPLHEFPPSRLVVQRSGDLLARHCCEHRRVDRTEARRTAH